MFWCRRRVQQQECRCSSAHQQHHGCDEQDELFFAFLGRRFASSASVACVAGFAALAIFDSLLTVEKSNANDNPMALKFPINLSRCQCSGKSVHHSIMAACRHNCR